MSFKKLKNILEGRGDFGKPTIPIDSSKMENIYANIVKTCNPVEIDALISRLKLYKDTVRGEQ